MPALLLDHAQMRQHLLVRVRLHRSAGGPHSVGCAARRIAGVLPVRCELTAVWVDVASVGRFHCLRRAPMQRAATVKRQQVVDDLLNAHVPEGQTRALAADQPSLLGNGKLCVDPGTARLVRMDRLKQRSVEAATQHARNSHQVLLRGWQEIDTMDDHIA